MSLHDMLARIPPRKVQYYGTMPEVNAVNNLNHESAYEYIVNYYQYGGKERVFDIGFNDRFKSMGKHMHTVILFYMGCLFSELIDQKLKAYIQKFIQKIDWYDFRYTWFLTCLYHDTASIIEEEEWEPGCSSDLHFYLGKYNIKNNVYNHCWENPHVKPYIYSESLIRNYFEYRVDHCHAIDHGIIAGYLLYDRLIKSYNKAWANHLLEYPQAEYEDFFYANLRWRKEHMAHFAIIADSIISHNIWLNNDSLLYKKYGLDPIVISDNNKLTSVENPLTFFLGLFDTIEPVKRFSNSNCLENINIQINANSLDIEFIEDRLEPNDLRKWIANIFGMKDWLFVECVALGRNKVKVRIE